MTITEAIAIADVCATNSGALNNSLHLEVLLNFYGMTMITDVDFHTALGLDKDVELQDHIMTVFDYCNKVDEDGKSLYQTLFATSAMFKAVYKKLERAVRLRYKQTLKDHLEARAYANSLEYQVVRWFEGLFMTLSEKIEGFDMSKASELLNSDLLGKLSPELLNNIKPLLANFMVGAGEGVEVETAETVETEQVEKETETK